jgi:hypothetical protein
MNESPRERVAAVARHDEVDVLLENRIRKPRDPFRPDGGRLRIEDQTGARLTGERLPENDTERPSRPAAHGKAR